MATLGDLAQIDAVAETDRVGVWDTSAAEGTCDKYASPQQVRDIVLTAENTFTARQQFSVGIGLSGEKKSFPHNSATALCKIHSSGTGVIAGAFLVGVAVSGGSNSSGQMWLLTVGYSNATMTKLSEALFGHSSIAITAAANTGTREITLTMTQINGTSATQTVQVSVVPVLYAADPTITLTML